MEPQLRPDVVVHVRTAAAVTYISLDGPSQPGPSEQRLSLQGSSVQRLIRAVGTSITGDVRVVVIRGDWAFADAQGAEDVGALDWLERPDTISVAVLSGAVSTARLALALACDVRIGADDAVLAMPPLEQESTPAVGIAAALVDAVGYARAFLLCVLGAQVSAQQAHQWGLLSAVAVPTELDATAERVVAELLALPRSATIETKALLRSAIGPPRPGAQRAASGSQERAARRRLARESAGYADG